MVEVQNSYERDWPAERIAAVGSSVLLIGGATIELVSQAAEVLGSEVGEALINSGRGSMLLGLTSAAVYHRVGQRRGTVRDRNYDQ